MAFFLDDMYIEKTGKAIFELWLKGGWAILNIYSFWKKKLTKNSRGNKTVLVFCLWWNHFTQIRLKQKKMYHQNGTWIRVKM